MSLKLVNCHLSSPSILVSRQLQKLVVRESSWSGGWAVAAAAWPAVRALVWELMTRRSVERIGGDADDGFKSAAECLWSNVSKVLFNNVLNGGTSSMNDQLDAI